MVMSVELSSPEGMMRYTRVGVKSGTRLLR
jgi:hypothetical protein